MASDPLPNDPYILPVVPGVVIARCPKPDSHTGMVTMVVAKGDTAVVIDTGVSGHASTALLPALRALGASRDDISALCSTHGHADHVGGTEELRRLNGAVTYLGAEDAELAGFPPDVPLNGAEILDLGTLRFEVLASPGHTPGSVCFYEPAHRLLIAGDAVQYRGSAGRLPVHYHSGHAYRSSLRRLLDLPVDLLVTGHPLRSSGLAGCLHRGAPACRELLTGSLAVSESVAAAVAAGVGTARVPGTADNSLHFPTLRQTILEELVLHPLYADLMPHDADDEDTTATLLSELRDLGTTLEAVPRVRR